MPSLIGKGQRSAECELRNAAFHIGILDSLIYRPRAGSPAFAARKFITAAHNGPQNQKESNTAVAYEWVEVASEPAL